MSERERQLAALTESVTRMRETNDPSLALQPHIVQQAQQLSETVDGSEDADASYALGWFHYARSWALEADERIEALRKAVSLLTLCLVKDHAGELPTNLFPLIASGAYPRACALHGRAVAESSIPLFDEARMLCERILIASPSDDPKRPDYLVLSAIVRWDRFSCTGDPADLDAAARADAEAVQILPPEDPRHAVVLADLGSITLERFRCTAQPGDLHDAVRHLTRAAAAITGPWRPVVLTHLAGALHDRYTLLRAPSDLDAALAHLDQAFEDIDDSHRAAPLTISGAVLESRFHLTGDQTDLTAAAQAHRDALQATDPQAADRSARETNLGTIQLTVYRNTGQHDDLEEALTWLRSAVDTATTTPTRVQALLNLTGGLRELFNRDGDLDDLTQAIAVCAQAVAATDTESSRQGKRALSIQGTLYALRAEFHDSSTDLATAVEMLSQSCTAHQEGQPPPAEFLTALGDALEQRYRRQGTPEDLDTALELLRQASRSIEPGHPNHVITLSKLATALRCRFERTRDLTDIDEAIGLCQEAIAATADGSVVRSLRLAELCGHLTTRYVTSGAHEDLDAAVKAGQSAQTMGPNSGIHHAVSLNNLALALRYRALHTAQAGDLNAAVAYGKQALDHPHTAQARRAQFSGNLGATLLMRFQRTGDRDDLQDAITAGRNAVRLIPDTDREKAKWLSNLAGMLHDRFHVSQDPKDADEAVKRAYQAVQTALDDDYDRGSYLCNLATNLHARFTLRGAPEDLDRALYAVRTAIAVAPADAYNLPHFYTTLGNILRSGYERSRNDSDGQAAVDALAKAAELAGPRHPSRPKILSNLAGLLHLRHDIAQDTGLRDAALACYAKVVSASTAAPSDRIRAARGGAVLAATFSVQQTADFLENAVLLLPRTAPRQLARVDRQSLISAQQGLAADAAAAVMEDTRLPLQQRARKALQLLETGRAVLMSQALGTRSDLSDLQALHPELAHRFEDVRRQLDSDPVGIAGERLPQTQDRHHLSDELDRLLQQIRSLQGPFASFGLPPSFEEMSQQAHAGPIVTFNVSDIRSDAFVLTPAGITVVPLAGLTVETVDSKTRAFHDALAAATHPDADRLTAQQTIRSTLQWLWDAAAEPVLDAMGLSATTPVDPTSLPRVWWATGGLLGLLPLHAAGYHTTNPTTARTLLDRVVSSYTPTIRALMYARQQAKNASSAQTATLAVAMATTPGNWGPLPHAQKETAALRQWFPDLVELTAPPDDHRETGRPLPTKANVLARLEDSALAHFACHGHSDPQDPADSALILQDHATDPLTVASLAPLNLPHAALAYLSACETSIHRNIGLTDEALYLTAAFQLAGFPRVVGTLWPINSRIAADFAHHFYEWLGSRPGPFDVDAAAHALHHATHKIRSRYLSTPTLWAAWLIYGA
ncbi:CHAT domain-containing protein [Streptomyces gilvifuscus]|uniref:CHAT domain-containing protein n=1 Tax=Streptomyces gilvifuscus TaxID=1550617 RepID=A0ABT5G6B9_9ACTN|nr:CHAT domain-containing protein [Streptomyces gilvifuscus]MDC2960418.1 CHAT domain-containing protein [Streptomyces gilvifuscus]